MSTNNPLLCTDVYKMSHMLFYPKGTTKVYSYLTTRTDKKLPFTVFFGLQYYLDYLSKPVTKEQVEEFILYRNLILGGDAPQSMKDKLYALVDLGYIPLEIKAVDEGSVMPVKNVLMTMTNTHPDFYWVVGFFESLLLKVWNTTTVASYSKKLKNLVTGYAERTCDDLSHINFQVHDFGYRGCSSEETAALSGAAHLINFLGTDTVPAVKLLHTHYKAQWPIGLSVPASEHSIMCSFGQENEIEAFENMLDTTPSGIVSIVSDTYNLWTVLTTFAEQLKPRILARDGKVVFRPDSGDPEDIICGDRNAPEGSNEYLGAIRLLDAMFGTTVNSKGYKLLNPKVGLIYGDGMYYERFSHILAKLEDMGYATSNLVVGIGGLLLQQHSRDDQGYAIKATYVEVNGATREIVKDPITDSGKKSHKGLMTLHLEDGKYITRDQRTKEEEATGLLTTVFLNGKVTAPTSLEAIRNKASV